jgi:hypothetical protein
MKKKNRSIIKAKQDNNYRKQKELTEGNCGDCDNLCAGVAIMHYFKVNGTGQGLANTDKSQVFNRVLRCGVMGLKRGKKYAVNSTHTCDRFKLRKETKENADKARK